METTVEQDSLSRFLQARPGLPKDAKGAGKRAYCAYEVGEKETRFLEIRKMLPNMSVCLPYSSLVEINADWRLGKIIALNFAVTPKPVIVTISGTELHGVYEALKQSKAIAIAEFDAAEHHPVTASIGAWIREIKVMRGLPPPGAPS